MSKTPVIKPEQIIIKTPEQIEGIRKSSQLAATALLKAKEFVVPGITTEEIDDRIKEFIEDRGGVAATLNYMGYPKNSCISVNEEVCHGIPGSRVLEEGDIVSIDIATILDGYFGDNCATYPVGQISEENRRLIDVAKQCMEIGIEQVKPGRMTGLIGAAIALYAQENNFTVVRRYCGHGVGIKFHEPPEIKHICRATSGVPIEEGMVFTIEPMINAGDPLVFEDRKDEWTVRTKDGKPSAQFEHTIAVTENGCEILTIPTI